MRRRSIPDPVEERREAMLDILGSWALEDALPDEVGMSVVRDYVAGRLTLAEAIREMRERPVASGKHA